jgi:hypothetical protein
MKKRSSIKRDLRTPKYRPRVVEDKRRKVRLGRAKLSIRDANGQWRDMDLTSFTAWSEARA